MGTIGSHRVVGLIACLVCLVVSDVSDSDAGRAMAQGAYADGGRHTGPIMDVGPKCRAAVSIADYPPPAPADLIHPTIPTFPCEPATAANICEIQEALNIYQPYLESFGWQTFVALNWPAVKNTDGVWVPDRARRIGDGTGDALPIWRTWLSSDQVFVQDPPAAWGERPRLAESCGVAADEFVIPYDERAFTTNQIEGTGPLIDQNGHWVQYDVRMNRQAYDYILGEGLHTAAGQRARAAKGDAIDMPAGSQPKLRISCSDWPDGPPREMLGAIDIKAAWKVLGEGDDAARYHTATMLLPPDEKGVCGRVQVGLAALHVKQKTPYGTGVTNATINPHIWSSFIHRDALCEGDRSGAFCDAKCTGDGCEPNTPPCPDGAACARPTPSMHPARGPRSQVERWVPATAHNRALNDGMQKALSAIEDDSVWQHYELLTTQWVMPLMAYNRIGMQGGFAEERDEKAADGAYLVHSGIVTPSFSANPLIETYTQESSTCIGCHRSARTAAGQPSDFSFQYRHAAERPGAAQ